MIRPAAARQPDLLCQQVPLDLLDCPAFQAAVRAMGAQIQSYDHAPHSTFSALMSWPARPAPAESI